MSDAGRQAALLIDADNLSVEGMDQAAADLRRRGLRISVLRAYGSADTLQACREFLHRHAARVVVNHGKGTTDAALVVDAMDLLHSGLLPAFVAVGSSDGDFAPLAVRLRETGRTVLCYAHAQKAALEELARVYAEVVPVGPQRQAAKAPAASPAAKKAPAKKSSAKEVPAKKAAARKAVKAATPAAALRDEVFGILEGFPGFRDGALVELGPVSNKLREARLLGKSASAAAFLRRLGGDDLELTPERQPNKLRLLRP